MMRLPIEHAFTTTPAGRRWTQWAFKVAAKHAAPLPSGNWEMQLPENVTLPNRVLGVAQMACPDRPGVLWYALSWFEQDEITVLATYRTVADVDNDLRLAVLAFVFPTMLRTEDRKWFDEHMAGMSDSAIEAWVLERYGADARKDLLTWLDECAQWFATSVAQRAEELERAREGHVPASKYMVH